MKISTINENILKRYGINLFHLKINFPKKNQKLKFYSMHILKN